MHLPNAPETSKPIDLKQAAQRTVSAGGWIHCFSAAIREGADMNGEQWRQFLVEVKTAGCGKLADTLEREYTKNHTTTVKTQASAMQAIKGHNAFPNALWAAQDATAQMNEQQRRQVVEALRNDGFHKLADTLVANLKQSAI